MLRRVPLYRYVSHVSVRHNSEAFAGVPSTKSLQIPTNNRCTVRDIALTRQRTFTCLLLTLVEVIVKSSATAVLGAVLALLTAPVTAQTSMKHRAAVEQHSEHVMPFDMNRTMHIFESKPDGGMQTVMVHDGDPKQMALVRSHLRKEAAAFSHRDFTDPVSIHGAAMPGLAELRSGAERIHITYASVPHGAAIRYRTRDPKLIAALHRWFAAQVADHGMHAMSH
jgi:hypothetical protein